MSLNLINIIFGMKVRQARLDAGLTLSEFAELCDLSPSYVTEIEKGRKYPRADKIIKMADALNRDYDDLVSIKLPPSLTYLESTLSSSAVQRFPFEEFGFEAGDLVTMLTRKPDKASALLHGILEVGRRYDIDEEEFLRSALRSYQEIHENYFPDLEEAAVQFRADFGKKYGWPEDRRVPLSDLITTLTEEYGYVIDDEAIARTADLSSYRSVFLQGKPPKLFINSALYSRQVRFIIARELGYCCLEIKERSTTSTPIRINTFQQLFNDFRAAYFAGALLMPRASFLEYLQTFFAAESWDPNTMLDMLAKYNVTPEMLLYRMSELVPQFFGVKLHFLRFHHRQGTSSYQLIKQLNMNRLLVPSGIGLAEHYCRRWLSVRLLREATAVGPLDNVEEMPVGVQRSEFLDSGDQFLCLGFARQLVLSPDVYSSVIVGFRVDDDLQNTIQFLDDPAIPRVLIGETCERCPLTPDQCQLRAAEPTRLLEQEQDRARRLAINMLREK
ncbi:MAG: helix-turn-helix domain-containing protein [Candidatus Promineifilaceae bacterium]|jgi:transcriptional regulator with XRE-family HTH domain